MGISPCAASARASACAPAACSVTFSTAARIAPIAEAAPLCPSNGRSVPTVARANAAADPEVSPILRSPAEIAARAAAAAPAHDRRTVPAVAPPRIDADAPMVAIFCPEAPATPRPTAEADAPGMALDVAPANAAARAETAEPIGTTFAEAPELDTVAELSASVCATLAADAPAAPIAAADASVRPTFPHAEAAAARAVMIAPRPATLVAPVDTLARPEVVADFCAALLADTATCATAAEGADRSGVDAVPDAHAVSLALSASLGTWP